MLKYISLLVFSAFLFSCATTKKTESLTIASALWQNWIGGIEGVGGTYYKLEINNSEDRSLEFESLEIDGKSILVDEGDVKKKGKVVTVIVNENRSAEKLSRNNSQPEPMKLRNENPIEAKLNLIVEGEKIMINVNSFKKATTKFFK